MIFKDENRKLLQKFHACVRTHLLHEVDEWAVLFYDLMNNALNNKPLFGPDVCQNLSHKLLVNWHSDHYFKCVQVLYLVVGS